MNNQLSDQIKRRKQQSVRQGRIAEWLAALFLICKGYRILERGYRTKSGEIDIIAKKADTVVMVEVKYRKELQIALDAVNPSSQKRIANAADIYMASRNDFARLSYRFDIIAVLPFKLPVHFKDAF